MRFGIQPQYRLKSLLVCVGVGLDGTKKLITAVPQHALNCFPQGFFLNFSLRWLEGDSFSFCLKHSFFLLKLSMAPDIQGMGFRPLSLLICI